ncbi:hypothetical protein [Streptomyces sp. NPDC090080]|uniref:hypothetical protein n=1 Tax=Streptomyces sp. NPDC090080 TaxID=3365939 RepID=UPI0037F137B1
MAAVIACTGGFVTSQPLPDGRVLVESWWLNMAPLDSDDPRTEPVGHWIADDKDDADATIAEFISDLARLSRPAS